MARCSCAAGWQAPKFRATTSHGTFRRSPHRRPVPGTVAGRSHWTATGLNRNSVEAEPAGRRFAPPPGLSTPRLTAACAADASDAAGSGDIPQRFRCGRWFRRGLRCDVVPGQNSATARTACWSGWPDARSVAFSSASSSEASAPVPHFRGWPADSRKSSRRKRGQPRPACFECKPERTQGKTFSAIAIRAPHEARGNFSEANHHRRVRRAGESLRKAHEKHRRGRATGRCVGGWIAINRSLRGGTRAVRFMLRQ